MSYTILNVPKIRDVLGTMGMSFLPVIIAMLISLPLEVLSIAQLYRDRADCEDCFDELKNRWDWGGFTTKDLKRCCLASRLGL